MRISKVSFVSRSPHCVSRTNEVRLGVLGAVVAAAEDVAGAIDPDAGQARPVGGDDVGAPALGDVKHALGRNAARQQVGDSVAMKWAVSGL